MTVAIARVTLVVAAAQSLKDKRAVVRRVKDLVRQKFNASIAEVGALDMWQRAILGITLVGGDRRFVESSLDEVLRLVRSKAEVVNEERELQTFGDGELTVPEYKYWDGRER